MKRSMHLIAALAVGAVFLINGCKTTVIQPVERPDPQHHDDHRDDHNQPPDRRDDHR